MNQALGILIIKFMKKQMDSKEKFLDKNRDIINKFDEIMSDDDVRSVIVSSEMGHFIRYLSPTIIHPGNDNFLTYMKKRVIIDVYQVAGIVRFIRKSDSLRFTIPCICGVYDDEPHNILK
jgi:hypothetical protein